MICSSAPAWINRHAVTLPNTLKVHYLQSSSNRAYAEHTFNNRSCEAQGVPFPSPITHARGLTSPTSPRQHIVDMFLGKRMGSCGSVPRQVTPSLTRNPLIAGPVGSLPTMGHQPEPGSLDCLHSHSQGISQHEWPPMSGSPYSVLVESAFLAPKLSLSRGLEALP